LFFVLYNIESEDLQLKQLLNIIFSNGKMIKKNDSNPSLSATQVCVILLFQCCVPEPRVG
jgi:hypothetical protein